MFQRAGDARNLLWKRAASVLFWACVVPASSAVIAQASDSQPVHATWTCQYTGARRTVSTLPGKGIEQKKQKVVKRWIAALHSKDGATRRDAAIALGELKSKNSIQPLVAALRDPEPLVRACADQSLVLIGLPAVNPLISVLKDKDQWAPVLSAVALSTIPAPSARDALVQALNDHNDKVILGAHTLFVKLGIPGSEPALIEALDTFPNRDMAEEFYNSGNPTLVEAARGWSSSFRQRLHPNQYGAVRWGSGSPLPLAAVPMVAPVRESMVQAQVQTPPPARIAPQQAARTRKPTLDEAVDQ